jgi:putative endonuclease
MVHVYAIKSLSKNYIYVGLTEDVDRRVTQHQKGYEKTTKPYRPFKLIYRESHKTRKEAREREKYLKSAAGKRFLRSIDT